MQSSLITRNIRIEDRRTSVRLEPELWRSLEDIARLEGVEIHDICTRIACEKRDRGGFTSALRVYILWYFRDRLRSADAQLRTETVESASAYREAS